LTITLKEQSVKFPLKSVILYSRRVVPIGKLLPEDNPVKSVCAIVAPGQLSVKGIVNVTP